MTSHGESEGVKYECECCEEMTCTGKKPGIGYVCDMCMDHWDEAFGSCRTHTPITDRLDPA